jgi:hypothetical protein
MSSPNGAQPAPNIDGLIYLLNQAGLALAQANDALARANARIEQLEAALEPEHAPAGNQ